jgi:hypothetical protein
MPLAAGVCSPPARWGGCRQTCDGVLGLGSPGSSWGWSWGRKGARRWTTTRQWRRSCFGLSSGEMWGPAKPCVRVGARVMPMGEAQMIGRLGKQAEGEFCRGGGNSI